MKPINEADLSIYLNALEHISHRFMASDTSPHNLGLISQMKWQAIQRHHAPVCPTCGPCYGECDNCEWCRTA